MTEPLQELPDWSELGEYPSSSAAEIDAAFLRSEGISSRVTGHSNFPGQPGKAIVWVDRSNIERARRFLKLPPVSESELEFLATGELPQPKDTE